MPAVIRFEKVSKEYRLGAGRETLRERLSSLPQRLVGQHKKDGSAEQFVWALQDVSFNVDRGEVLGIIGPNGAGKTTVLKILANITKPTLGILEVQGRLAALIELGAGFHPDLTGRENIYLNGIILGLSRRDIQQRFDEIVDFAELERFIDTPVKRYSSGMYARLGFSVAAHVEPDVFLIDEVLSVGDTAFQAKCQKRMNDLRNQEKTLIFISHNMSAIQRTCTRVIVLYQGQIAFEGSAAEAVAEYSNIIRSNANSKSKPNTIESGALSGRRMTHGARIVSVALLSPDGEPTNVIESGSLATLVVETQFFEDTSQPIFACTIVDENGTLVYDVTTRSLSTHVPDFLTGDRVRTIFQLQTHLLDGIYTIKVDIAYADLSCYYDFIANAISFVVTGGDKASGVANLQAAISFTQSKSES